MNKQECDIMIALMLESFINQRILSEVTGHSLGVINRSLKELMKTGYLNDEVCLTAKAIAKFKYRINLSFYMVSNKNIVIKKGVIKRWKSIMF